MLCLDKTNSKNMKLRLDYEDLNLLWHKEPHHKQHQTDHNHQKGFRELQTVMNMVAKVHVADNLRIIRQKATQHASPVEVWPPFTTPGYLSSLNKQFPGLFSALLEALKGKPSGNMVSNSSLREEREQRLFLVRQRRADSAVMYLPVNSGGSVSTCPSYADTVAASLTQMAFVSMLVTAFNAVANIANNINNNNRNNNINSNSNIASNNANVASSSNNANQLNVVLPPPAPGRKKRDDEHDHQGRSSSTLCGQGGAAELTLCGQGGTAGSNDASSNILVIRLNKQPQNLEMQHPSVGQDTGECLSHKIYAQAALTTLQTLQHVIPATYKSQDNNSNSNRRA